MPKLTLYHAAPSRSSIVRWMLEELGEPFDIQLLSLKKGENRAPEYLAINPMGKVPALRHGDTIITEAAGHLLLPGRRVPAGETQHSRRRPAARQPISSGCSSHRAASSRRSPSAPFPRKEPASRSTLGFGDFDTVMDVLAKGAAPATPT